MADDVSAAPNAEAVHAPAFPAMSLKQVYALLCSPGAPLEVETKTIRGVETGCWKNAPPSLRALLLTGRSHGQKEFLVYEDERATYDAFYRAWTR